MRSYKQWQALNESLFPLGLSNPQNVSGIVGRFQYLDEKKKHMDSERDPEEDYDDDEESSEDDSDEEEGGSEKKGSCGGEDAPMFCKKNMKKKMKNECECEEKGKKSPEMVDDDGDEDDHDHEEPDGDEGGEDYDDDGDGGDMKRPLGFMKKKGMKKKMNKKMKKEHAAPNDFLQSFNSYTAPENQMTSEENWWKSVTGHFSNPNQKFSDGFTEYMEDYLIDPATQQNFVQGNAQQSGPRPGEVGYAPQQRVGWFGNSVNQEGTEDPFA